MSCSSKVLFQIRILRSHPPSDSCCCTDCSVEPSVNLELVQEVPAQSSKTFASTTSHPSIICPVLTSALHFALRVLISNYLIGALSTRCRNMSDINLFSFCSLMPEVYLNVIFSTAGKQSLVKRAVVTSIWTPPRRFQEDWIAQDRTTHDLKMASPSPHQGRLLTLPKPF
jgi:hypothetical protein